MPLRVTNLQEDLSDQEPAGYYDRKKAAMSAGKVVWARRNFDADGGLVLDLFSGTKPLGFVEVDYSRPDAPASGFNAVAYAYAGESPEQIYPPEGDPPAAPAVAAFHLAQFCRRQALIE